LSIFCSRGTPPIFFTSRYMYKPCACVRERNRERDRERESVCVHPPESHPDDSASTVSGRELGGSVQSDRMVGGRQEQKVVVGRYRGISLIRNRPLPRTAIWP